jgi:hypothetical protein
VLRALEARAEPRREGKRVIFDEPISIRGMSSSAGKDANGEGFVLVDD